MKDFRKANVKDEDLESDEEEDSLSESESSDREDDVSDLSDF